jgi:hypothetical protein
MRTRVLRLVAGGGVSVKDVSWVLSTRVPGKYQMVRGSSNHEHNDQPWAVMRPACGDRWFVLHGDRPTDRWADTDSPVIRAARSRGYGYIEGFDRSGKSNRYASRMSALRMLPDGRLVVASYSSSSRPAEQGGSNAKERGVPLSPSGAARPG